LWLTVFQEFREMTTKHEVAVLLNANAKQVDKRTIKAIRRHLPEEDLYVSRNSEEAQQMTREILDRGIPTILTGGGDGTLVHFLNDSIPYIDNRNTRTANPASRYPLVGILKMGTGNGIATYVGAEEYVPDLHKMMNGYRACRRPLSLIETAGKYCHFSGFGLDAAILNDYREIKDTWLGRRFKYAASVVGLSLPRQIKARGKRPIVRIINTGSPAYRIGPEGQALGNPVPKGGLIYEGPILIAGVSTMPYYGYKMKMYPFVGLRPGMMQLRISWAGVIESLTKLPKIWNGTYRSDSTRDFYCDSIKMTFEKEVPFQIGGDGQGERKEATFSLSKRSIDLIDLTSPPQGTIH